MARPRPHRDPRCKHEGRVSAEDQEALKQLKGIVLVLKPSTANDKCHRPCRASG